jgi:polyisoprenoid-binding protein YceI
MGPSPGLPASDAQGEQLVIAGTIYDRDCNPLPGVSFKAWQTDPQGVYGPGHGGESIECCYYQGSGVTDEHGRYKLVTVIPGHYAGEDPAPPAHIHLEISHPTAGGWMAEIVFAGDPSLQGMSQAGYTVVTLEYVGDPDTRTAYQRGFADIRLPGVSGAVPPSISGGRRSFRIDPQRSQAAYHIREKFTRLPIQIGATAISSLLEGDIEIDLDDPALLRSMRVQVDLRQLKSDKPSRDEKLFDDWLEINRFPHASFTATHLEGFPSGYIGQGEVSFRLLGELTIRDVTRQVAFDVDALLLGTTLTGVASTYLKMSDFGISPPNLLDFVVVEDDVELTVNIVAGEIGP